MSELKERLDALISATEPSPDALERTNRLIRRRRRNRRLSATALGLGLTGMLVAGGFALLTRQSGVSTLGTSGREAASVFPLSGSIVDGALHNGTLWVLTCEQNCAGEAKNSVGRAIGINLASKEATESDQISSPQALTVTNEGVWVIGFWNSLLTQLDPRTGDVLGTVELQLPFEVLPGDREFRPFDIAASGGSIWVTNGRWTVAQVEAATRTVVDMIEVDKNFPVPAHAAGDDEGIWVSASIGGVYRIDPESHAIVGSVQVRDGERLLAVEPLVVGGGSVWANGVWARKTEDEAGHQDYILTDDAAIARIDSATGAVVDIIESDAFGRLVFADRAVWGISYDGTRVAMIDPTTTSVAATFDAPDGAQFIAVGYGSLWAVDDKGNLVEIPVAEG